MWTSTNPRRTTPLVAMTTFLPMSVCVRAVTRDIASPEEGWSSARMIHWTRSACHLNGSEPHGHHVGDDRLNDFRSAGTPHPGIQGHGARHHRARPDDQSGDPRRIEV